jgi:aspartate racemase
MPDILGILGGMGPLASAEFVKTIYEFNLTAREQEMPACVLISDPTIPDRTEAILHDDERAVLHRLEQALTQLVDAGATRTVIACITAHHFVPKMTPALQDRLISLIDVIIDDVLRADAPHLLFCTNGTRKASVFQQAARWAQVEPFVVLPSAADQQRIHTLLYRVKQGDVGQERLADIDDLLASYHTGGLIAGCTEMHLLTKQLAARPIDQPHYQIADPLLTIARTLCDRMGATGRGRTVGG